MADSDYSDLRALLINTTLKKSPEVSHTQGLMDILAKMLRDHGVAVDSLRAVDHDIAPGVSPDMTKQGWDVDDWPDIFEGVLAADILIVGTPIWLGERSSVCSRVIERLYGNSSQRNDKGQYVYYGRVAGCVVTGNEDGVKNCAKSILYSLQHVGFTVPPQAETGWIGDIGPGPSFLDDESEGRENEYTQRTSTFMTWNLLHMARVLKDYGGVPGYGNLLTAWENGERFGHPDANQNRDR